LMGHLDCEEAEAWAEKAPGALCILANVNA
jgi:hypothetical protein